MGDVQDEELVRGVFIVFSGGRIENIPTRGVPTYKSECGIG